MSEIVVGYALDTILLNSNPPDDYDNQSPLINTIAHTRKRSGTVPRTDIIVNTKVGRYEADPQKQFDFSYITTMASVKRSIERMNCSYIDVLQLHDPEFAPSMDILLNETIPALLECRDKLKWTKAIGLTGYPLEVQHEILVKSRGLAGGNGVVFDQSLVYCHSNLHDMSLFNEQSYQREKQSGSTSNLQSPDLSGGDCSERASTDLVSFADFCAESSIHIMAAAPLSMGLLTETGPPSWHPAPPSLKDACACVVSICEIAGVNISSLSILFAISRTRIPCTLLGMRDLEDVDTAADLAIRFATTLADEENEDDDVVLRRVLTENEYVTLQNIVDRESGPFASVWSTGEYRWDGRAEAIIFEVKSYRDK